MVTKLGVITQLARNGAPEQLSETVPVNPPTGESKVPLRYGASGR